jgi:hypothetical protein
MSRRLANRLGLTEFRLVYLQDKSNGNITDGNISLFPVSVHCEEGLSRPLTIQICPVVSTQAADYFWDMTIGSNILNNYPEILGVATVNSINHRSRQPTPGPGYDARSIHLGSLFYFAPYNDIPVNNNQSDVFLEFCCRKSSAISRLALNKKRCQLIVIYEGSFDSDGATIYRYAGVSRELESQLENALLYNEGGETSLGRVMQIVKGRCTVATIESFPSDTVLVNFTTVRDW